MLLPHAGGFHPPSFCLGKTLEKNDCFSQSYTLQVEGAIPTSDPAILPVSEGSRTTKTENGANRKLQLMYGTHQNTKTYQKEMVDFNRRPTIFSLAG